MDRIGEPSPLYYHQNTLWSSFALTNSAGVGVEGYSYDAYGYQTVILPGLDMTLWTADDVILPGAKSSYGNPFLYTGQRLDPEAGLVYYKNRYNSTFFGRFMSRDPLDYDAGDMNLYAYIGDRPTRETDPTGLVRTLQIQNEQGPTPGKCGRMELVIHWLLSEASKKGGHVIQFITFEWSVKDCDNNSVPNADPRTSPLRYWEVWPIAADNTQSNEPARDPSSDTWFWPNNLPWGGNCTKGNVSITAKARFYEALTPLPGNFGFRRNNPGTFAGTLQSTVDSNVPANYRRLFTDPRAGGTNIIDRELKFHWDCCGDNQNSDTVLDSKKP